MLLGSFECFAQLIHDFWFFAQLTHDFCPCIKSNLRVDFKILLSVGRKELRPFYVQIYFGATFQVIFALHFRIMLNLSLVVRISKRTVEVWSFFHPMKKLYCNRSVENHFHIGFKCLFRSPNQKYIYCWQAYKSKQIMKFLQQIWFAPWKHAKLVQALIFDSRISTYFKHQGANYEHK